MCDDGYVRGFETGLRLCLFELDRSVGFDDFRARLVELGVRVRECDWKYLREALEASRQ